MDEGVVSDALDIEDLIRTRAEDSMVDTLEVQLSGNAAIERHLRMMFQIMDRINGIASIIVNGIGNMADMYARIFFFVLPGKCNPLIYPVGFAVRPERIYNKVEKNFSRITGNIAGSGN